MTVTLDFYTFFKILWTICSVLSVFLLLHVHATKNLYKCALFVLWWPWHGFRAAVTITVKIRNKSMRAMRDIINVLLIFQSRVITSRTICQKLWLNTCNRLKKNLKLNCLSNIQASSDRTEKDSATRWNQPPLWLEPICQEWRGRFLHPCSAGSPWLCPGSVWRAAFWKMDHYCTLLGAVPTRVIEKYCGCLSSGSSSCCIADTRSLNKTLWEL